MNLDEIRNGLQIVQMLATAVIAVYVWFTNRDKANKQAIEQLRTDFQQQNAGQQEEIKKLQERVLQAESDIKHLPNHDALAQLHERINEVGHELSGLMGEFKSMNHTLQLIHQHLMDRK
jgi:CII-binding regulator of phage lambda lysogenization HflD